ncbi:hypothetical protein ACFFP0_00730 [Rhizobium puerariae]|uniref:Uncharacterized protein n=1 Tax=Rhizobium puerariae TaxID=1585791 RepID=A0ABV6A9V7_9HYPH
MSLRKDFENLPSMEIILRGREFDFHSTCSVPAMTPPRYDPIFTPIFAAALGPGGLGLSAGIATAAAPVLSAVAVTPVIPGVYWERA